jgi:hypothetical protein
MNNDYFFIKLQLLFDVITNTSILPAQVVVIGVLVVVASEFI